jgi:hypothetical protein
MKMHEKWKLFAFKQFVSSYEIPNESDIVKVYDALMNADDMDEIDSLMEKYEIVFWEPFENYPPAQVVEFIFDCALAAEEYEEGWKNA